MEQLHNSNVNYGTGVKVGVLVGVFEGVGVEVGQTAEVVTQSPA